MSLCLQQSSCSRKAPSWQLYYSSGKTDVIYPFSFTEEPDLYESLQLHLERFLPGLLQAMTFTSSSREVLDLENDDYAVPDKATDIKPHMHKSRTAGASSSSSGSGSKDIPSLAARMGMTASDVEAAGNGFDEGDEEDYDEGDEEEDENEDAEWTLRKASAKALSNSAEAFEEALLDVLLPLLQPMLSNREDWLQREAAICALGYMAFGCHSSMHGHLPSLVPFLLENLKDDNVGLLQIRLP